MNVEVKVVKTYAIYGLNVASGCALNAVEHATVRRLISELKGC